MIEYRGPQLVQVIKGYFERRFVVVLNSFWQSEHIPKSGDNNKFAIPSFVLSIIEKWVNSFFSTAVIEEAVI